MANELHNVGTLIMNIRQVKCNNWQRPNFPESSDVFSAPIVYILNVLGKYD